MAGAFSTYPGTLDNFSDGAYDPGIADAVNALEVNSGATPPTAITAAIAETCDDQLVTTTITLTSGTDQATIIGLRKGQVVNKVTLNSGTASGTISDLWVAFTAVASTTVLAVSTNITTGTTPSSASETISLATPWTVPATGYYYLHVVCVASTTQPTYDAFAATAGVRATQAPIVAGTGATSQTTPPAVGGTLSVTLTATKGIYAVLS